MLANRFDHAADPCLGNCVPQPSPVIARDKLQEVLAGKCRSKPVLLLLCAARYDRLVHQVVTKDCGAVGAPLGNRFPEPGLYVPPLGLLQLVVPDRHISLVVAREPRQIQIEALLFRQSDEVGQPVELSFHWLVFALHELAELKMNSHDVRAELLHLAKVCLDFVPLRVPVVFDQPPLLIVIVIKSPWDKWLLERGQYKFAPVLGNLDPALFGRSCSCWQISQHLRCGC